MEIENEEGSLGLTLLCPAVEEELSGEDESKTRIPSWAVETAMVSRTTIGASILGFLILLILFWILSLS